MAKKLLQWVICHIIRKSGEDKFLLSKSLTLLKEKKKANFILPKMP